MSSRFVLFVLSVSLTSLRLVKSNENNSSTATTLDLDWELRDNSELGWITKCKFQPDGYDCSKMGLSQVYKFYYDIKMEDCRTHIFGNCLYNYNQFETLKQCHEICREPGIKALPRTNISESLICRLQPDFGTCNDYYPMYYYDMTTRDCKGFSYSGCGGNQNRFPNVEYCSAVCSPSMLP